MKISFWWKVCLLSCIKLKYWCGMMRGKDFWGTWMPELMLIWLMIDRFSKWCSWPNIFWSKSIMPSQFSFSKSSKFWLFVFFCSFPVKSLCNSVILTMAWYFTWTYSWLRFLHDLDTPSLFVRSVTFFSLIVTFSTRIFKHSVQNISFFRKTSFR